MFSHHGGMAVRVYDYVTPGPLMSTPLVNTGQPTLYHNIVHSGIHPGTRDCADWEAVANQVVIPPSTQPKPLTQPTLPKP